MEIKKSKIAFVTGGSRGLGKDMALNLAQKGMDVILTFNSQKEEAEEVEESEEESVETETKEEIEEDDEEIFEIEIDYKTLTIVFLWDPNYRNTYYPIKSNYAVIQRFYK